MPKVRVEVPNELSADESLERTREPLVNVLDAFQAYNVDIQTEGHKRSFTCSSFGFKFSGSVVSENNLTTAEIDVPFAAVMFKDKIERAVRKHLTAALTENAQC